MDQCPELAAGSRRGRGIRDAHLLPRSVGCPLPHPGLRAPARGGGEHRPMARRRHRRGLAAGGMAVGPPARPAEVPLIVCTWLYAACWVVLVVPSDLRASATLL